MKTPYLIIAHNGRLQTCNCNNRVVKKKKNIDTENIERGQIFQGLTFEEQWRNEQKCLEGGGGRRKFRITTTLTCRPRGTLFKAEY